ncbi:MAG: hypothetical protein HBSAPP03_05320 [Phycisphaerae bacterium]|nr:MAG: hypothetical protein HBSAPP03_05320 [Phycisphaerae bacterium]
MLVPASIVPPYVMASRSRSSSPRRTSANSAGVSSRTKAVWGVFVASMTVVGGLMLALDRGPRGGADGFSLPPLAALAGRGGVEAVLDTPEPIVKGRWQAIVIHDTGASSATPESLDQQARAVGLRGLGFHFVIGNGNGLGDGQIHAGQRWLSQVNGAHAAGKQAEWFNRNAIGICLVGNGDRRTFTENQIERVTQLVDVLMRECGIPADRVYLHRDIADTPSPGRFFPQAQVRAQLGVR